MNGEELFGELHIIQRAIPGKELESVIAASLDRVRSVSQGNRACID
jgi:hypothetical protein